MQQSFLCWLITFGRRRTLHIEHTHYSFKMTSFQCRLPDCAYVVTSYSHSYTGLVYECFNETLSIQSLQCVTKSVRVSE